MRELIGVLINDRENLLMRLDRNDESNRQFTTSVQQLVFWNSQMHEIINSTIEMYATTKGNYKELSIVIDIVEGIP